MAVVAVAVGLAGCAAGAGVDDDVPSGGFPAVESTQSSAPAEGTASGPGGESSVVLRREGLLDALREAGVPVSESGDREMRAAELACVMVAGGATADDLALLLTEWFTAVSDTKARELSDIVVSHC